VLMRDHATRTLRLVAAVDRAAARFPQVEWMGLLRSAGGPRVLLGRQRAAEGRLGLDSMLGSPSRLCRDRSLVGLGGRLVRGRPARLLLVRVLLYWLQRGCGLLLSLPPRLAVWRRCFSPG